jgi:hypothetical protein
MAPPRKRRRARKTKRSDESKIDAEGPEPRGDSTATLRDRLARVRALLYPARVRAITHLLAEWGARLSRFVERSRHAVLITAFLALLVAGLHVGSDRLDDYLFVVINGIDALADGLMSFVIQKIGALFDASEDSIAALTGRAIDLVDLELKTSIARFLALVVELAADVIVGRFVFAFRMEDLALPAILPRLRTYWEKSTALKVAGPMTVALAAVPGALSLSREVQVGVHALVRSGIESRTVAGVSASIAAAVTLILIVARLAIPALIAAVACADRGAVSMRAAIKAPTRRRSLRGLAVALVPLPIAALAFIATPIVHALGALFSW